MALHRKYDELLALEPDIAVIPECANSKLLEKNAPKFKPKSMVWVGDKPQKGLGVFTFKTFIAIEQPIHRGDIPYIAPIKIIGPTSFNLLGVWACHSKPNSYEAEYGPFSRALRLYREFVREGPSVVAGDFNNNVLWDRPTKIDKHSKNVDDLTDLGLRSAYHFSRNVEQDMNQSRHSIGVIGNVMVLDTTLIIVSFQPNGPGQTSL